MRESCHAYVTVPIAARAHTRMFGASIHIYVCPLPPGPLTKNRNNSNYLWILYADRDLPLCSGGQLCMHRWIRTSSKQKHTSGQATISSENSHEGVRTMYARIDVCRNTSLTRSLSLLFPPSLFPLSVCAPLCVSSICYSFIMYLILISIKHSWFKKRRRKNCLRVDWILSNIFRRQSTYMLQYVAVHCSVLQYVAVRCNVWQYVAACCSVLQCVTVRCNILQRVAVCCSALQCFEIRCSVL